MLILKVTITIYDDDFYLLLPRGPTLNFFFQFPQCRKYNVKGADLSKEQLKVKICRFFHLLPRLDEIHINGSS